MGWTRVLSLLWAQSLGQCPAVLGTQEASVNVPRVNQPGFRFPLIQSWAPGQPPQIVPPLAHATLPPAAGPGPQQRARGTHPVLPEDSEREGSLEEELGALPHPSTSADGEHRGGRTRDPILLPLPGPLFTEGLADSALEDGECLVNPWSLHRPEGSPCVFEERRGPDGRDPVSPRQLRPVGSRGEDTPHAGDTTSLFLLQWKACDTSSWRACCRVSALRTTSPLHHPSGAAPVTPQTPALQGTASWGWRSRSRGTRLSAPWSSCPRGPGIPGSGSLPSWTGTPRRRLRAPRPQDVTRW